MAHGGARARSGPAPDPRSGRSDRRGLNYSALPNEGYKGEIPAWPLMKRMVHRWEFEDKRRFQVLDVDATEAVAEREAELWEWAWRTPQAAAWARESWRWLTVANWVRTQVIIEGDEATAADKGSIHRFADQIGMSPDGLKINGWAIAAPEIEPEAEKPAEQPARASSRSKLKVVAT